MKRARNHIALFAVGTASWFMLGTTIARAETPVDGMSFADDPGTLYAQVRVLAGELATPVHWDPRSTTVYIGNKSIPETAQRSLFDGQRLVAIRTLSQLLDGASIHFDDASGAATISYNDRIVVVRAGEKKVLVNLDEQRMRAYQGDLLVLDTPVSTGRSGHSTPTGNYSAGPLKTPMLISRKYNDAKMPYSVQIRGDYVIHGYSSVPDYPASHGCVRVPLTAGNPAKWFYD